MAKLLVICGPTATGKTALGINLAQKFKGEIISADSRQVYKGLDILTGKDLSKDSKLIVMNRELGINNNNFSIGYRTKNGIPIWLVDIVPLDYVFNVGEYKKIADKVIENLKSRSCLPIIVGGSGLYIKALTVALDFIIIPPNKLLRKNLSSLSKEDLAKRLIEIDPYRWEMMNESDRANPRRLIRAIELSHVFKDKNISKDMVNKRTRDDILMIGLAPSTKKKLYEMIDKRIEKRLKDGVIEEVEDIFHKGYDSQLPALSASGYRPLLRYWERTVSLANAIRDWKAAEHEYARRQLNWFRRDKRIIWFDPLESNIERKIEEIVGKWYTLG